MKYKTFRLATFTSVILLILNIIEIFGAGLNASFTPTFVNSLILYGFWAAFILQIVLIVLSFKKIKKYKQGLQPSLSSGYLLLIVTLFPVCVHASLIFFNS